MPLFRDPSRDVRGQEINIPGSYTIPFYSEIVTVTNGHVETDNPISIAGLQRRGFVLAASRPDVSEYAEAPPVPIRPVVETKAATAAEPGADPADNDKADDKADDKAAPAVSPADTVAPEEARPHAPQHPIEPASVETHTAPVVQENVGKPNASDKQALQQVVSAAGMQWVETDAARHAAVQAEIQAAPQPARPVRVRKPAPAVANEPLVQVETNRQA